MRNRYPSGIKFRRLIEVNEGQMGLESSEILRENVRNVISSSLYIMWRFSQGNDSWTLILKVTTSTGQLFAFSLTL